MGTSFGRGGATTFQQDLQNSDCIVIQGSNFAECHPVGFQWVMEAKARGAKVIHIDPRFTRTSAVADTHVPLRAGSDIAFLGGLVNYVLTEGKWFEEYVRCYTNASFLVREDFRDTEDLGGVFSGFDPDSGTCMSASAEVRVNRGSTWITVAPRRFASTTHWKPTGCASAMFEPWMTMQSEFCRSCWKSVAPPRPKLVPRPGTVLLCHMRAWFSICKAPIAVNSFLMR